MKKVWSLLLVLIGVVLILWSFKVVLAKPAAAKYQTPTLQISGKMLKVEVAATEAAREQGLSGRAGLEAGHGMLFIFPESGLYGFWMKDMKFPIDVVWLDEDKKVIDIARNLQPSSFPQVFYPPVPVKYVLETNPGEL